MIQLFTQSKTMDGISVTENSQDVKISSSEVQNENGFEKQLEEVIPGSNESNESNETEDKVHPFQIEDNNQLQSDDIRLIYNVTHLEGTEEFQIQLQSDEPFESQSHVAVKGEKPVKALPDGISKSLSHSADNVSEEGMNLKQALKILNQSKSGFDTKESSGLKDAKILHPGKSGTVEKMNIQTGTKKETGNPKQAFFFRKEVFTLHKTGNHNRIHVIMDTSNTGKGVVQEPEASGRNVKAETTLHSGNLFESINLMNKLNTGKELPPEPQVSGKTVNQNSRTINLGGESPVRDSMKGQAAGLSALKEMEPVAEKKSKNPDKSLVFKLASESERDSLRSTVRSDFQQSENIGFSNASSKQQINRSSGFDPVLTEVDIRESGVKNAGEVINSEASEKKIGHTRESMVLKPDQSVVFQQAERRDFSIRMAKVVKQGLQSGKAQGKGWQKHQFTMDDGSKVQLSFRKADGAIQLQLGSVNNELNKLIQQNVQDIRQHLEEQMNVEVNLQFQETASENGNSLLADKNSDSEQPGSDGEQGSAKLTEKKAQSSGSRTRLFGFNSNEWTA